MEPSSFATICTKSCKHELIGFLLSLSIHHPNAKVYVICDCESKENYDIMSYKPPLQISWYVDLDKYSKYNRQQMSQLGIWSEFQMAKSRVLDIALSEVEDCLFLDSDIIITDKVCDIDHTKDIGVSPGFINEERVSAVGKYNGGMLWTKNKTIPALWRKYTKTSRYFDQASIEDLVREFKTSFFEFGEEYNVQSWRFIVGEEPASAITSYIKPSQSECKLYYKSNTLKSIHTHFAQSQFKNINDFFIHKMKQARMYKELLIIFRVIHNKWVIHQPKKPTGKNGNNDICYFRQYLVMFHTQYKDVSVVLEPGETNMKIEPNIILNNHNTLQYINSEIDTSPLMIIGNRLFNDRSVLEQSFPYTKIIPWIYCPYAPIKLENIVSKVSWKSFNDRTNERILTSYDPNDIQLVQWKDYFTGFHCTNDEIIECSYEEYIKKLMNFKYGLCLLGNSMHCHTFFELMAVGTVPFITPDTNIIVDTYNDPLIENIHYLCVDKPSDINIHTSITSDKWTSMSKECMNWYYRNVHSSNMWQIIMRHILER
jgi:hypothetical protein